MDDSDAPGAAPAPFSRDRLTGLTYSLAAVFGYAFASLGPAMPLLREDLGMNRTLGGLHFTLLALGATASGFFSDRVTARWGRRATFWVGGGMAAAGVALVGLGRHPGVSLAGAALIGGPGSAMLVAIQSTLADKHAAHRAIAITEANTATAVGTIVPPLVIGGFVAAGIGWRPALAIPVLAWTALILARSGEQFPRPIPSPEDTDEPRTRRRPLPGAYWWYWAALIPSVGSEWCMGGWGAGYLVDIAGTSEGVASASMTAFFGAMVAGRLVGARLARRHSPAVILYGSAAIAAAGFMVFWAGTTPPVIVPGLFITGFGIAAFFPMLLTLGIETVPTRPDTAAARTSIAAGLSVMVAPLALGAIADASGIRPAYGVVPGMFAAVALLTLLGRRAARRTA